MSFLSPSALPDQELLEVARVLHDMKNEIIAFGTSIRRFTSSGDASSRLALQYESGRHLDAARGLAASLAAVTSLLAPPHVEDLDFVLFLQEYLSQTMLSVPAHVRIVTPRSATASLHIVTAPAYIRSILDNLVKNAVEAMPDGGDLAIDWAYDGETRHVILEVSDTGIGMDAGTIDAVRGEGPLVSAKEGGSALGLATVRGMVHRLSGDFEVSSVKGEGTRCVLTLPNLEESPG
jgi:signal transduction histidine kinase